MLVALLIGIGNVIQSFQVTFAILTTWKTAAKQIRVRSVNLRPQFSASDPVSADTKVKLDRDRCRKSHRNIFGHNKHYNRLCRGHVGSVGKASWIKVPQKRCNWTDVSLIPSCVIGVKKNPRCANYKANKEVSAQFGMCMREITLQQTRKMEVSPIMKPIQTGSIFHAD